MSEEGELKKRMELLRQHKNFRKSDLTMLAEFEMMIDEVKKDLPHKIHCSKTFGSETDYDDYNVFEYEKYNTEDLESCQELIKEYEEKIKKWFGGSAVKQY